MSNNITINTTPITTPSNGTLTIGANGSITYTPNANFIGVDSFDYVICDDGIPSLCDTATVYVTVVKPADNNPPFAGTDVDVIAEGGSSLGNLLANDGDPDGDNITINTTPIVNPANGTVTISPNGDYVYVPNPNFTGTDQFVYEICDDGTPTACDRALVTIIVLPNNPAGNLPPVAVGDDYITYTNITVSGNVTGNDFDPNNDNINIIYKAESNQVLPNTKTIHPIIGFYESLELAMIAKILHDNNYDYHCVIVTV